MHFNAGAEDISIRIHAAIIMEDLCHGYNLDRAQGFMASVIPKVNLCQSVILKISSRPSPI